jgi:hypothetical protein
MKFIQKKRLSNGRNSSKKERKKRNKKQQRVILQKHDLVKKIGQILKKSEIIFQRVNH